jgi:hypothetical protein
MIRRLVEAFAAQRADPAFRDCIRARCSNWCADDAYVGATEHRVEGGGDLAVAVADQEPILGGVVAQVHERIARLLGDPGACRLGRDPRDVHAAVGVLDHDEDVEAAEKDGIDVGESIARMVWGTGSMPAFCKILHTVETATVWPPMSSPWMRRYPQVGFSRAILSTRARIG